MGSFWYDYKYVGPNTSSGQWLRYVVLAAVTMTSNPKIGPATLDRVVEKGLFERLPSTISP